MSADVIHFDPRPPQFVRVELSTPGRLHDGRAFYVLDYVEDGGGRTNVWDGTDLVTARRELAECSVDGLPLYDRTAGRETSAGGAP